MIDGRIGGTDVSGEHARDRKEMDYLSRQRLLGLDEKFRQKDTILSVRPLPIARSV